MFDKASFFKNKRSKHRKVKNIQAKFRPFLEVFDKKGLSIAEISSIDNRNHIITYLEANHSQNRGVPLFFPSDSHP